MEVLFTIFTAFGLSASTGLNAYIPLLVVSLLAKFTNLITLQSPWNALESWWTIGALIILSFVEFFADKFPAVNHVNDAIQTFIRPAAGAIVFAASSNVITDINPVVALILGLLVSGSVHATKSLAVRPAVTATTGGAGNIPISILEDILATVVSIVAIILPALIVGFTVLAIILAAYWINLRQNRTRKVRNYSSLQRNKR
ncbi:MAG: DUF4126 domain-containing protein [Chloroflexi bacterium]|nr:MAG: DUF4126 domain-containing protein [Chloroflexota bacterium]